MELLKVSLPKFLVSNFELKPPMKLSPAAVVSIALTLYAGTISQKSFPIKAAPFSPRVIIANLTPLPKNISPAFLASSISFIWIPVKSSASVSFGTIISV